MPERSPDPSALVALRPLLRGHCYRMLGTEELYRVETKDGEILEVPPEALTPLMTESDRLKADFGKAKSSTDPSEKVAFLRKFNEEYSQNLTGEIEYFQMLAQKLAYLRIQAGQEIACNVDTETRHGVESQLEGERVADENSDYSGMYQVVARYTNMKSANVLLLLPSDKDTSKNAIITFRGTAASIDKQSQQEGESTGVRADLDVNGIGKTAFDLAEPTLRGFLKEARAYDRITISGHSLGGAMAQRFYAMASSECPDKLRLLVYQSAPVDRATAEEAKRNTQGGDVVGVHVRLEGVDQPQPELLEDREVGVDLLDDRVDEHRVARDGIGDQVGVGGRHGLEHR
jgi:hypothetical protein